MTESPHLKALMLTRLELTPAICQAISAIGRAIKDYRPGEMSAALLEIPKIALADAVLAAIREQLILAQAEGEQLKLARRARLHRPKPKPAQVPIVEIEMRRKRTERA